MNRSKHLTVDSPCPPPLSDPKTIRIYSMLFCPFAERVFLVAIAKGIKVEVVNVNVTSRPTWLTDKYPGGKVPLLETSAGVLSESLTISEYLDLLPSSAPSLADGDLFKRMQDRNLADQFQGVISTIVTLFFGDPITDPGEAAKLLGELETKLRPFDAALATKGTPFFGSADASSPGLLDFMMWPFIERFPVLEMLYGKLVPGFDFEFRGSSPMLATWVETMMKDPTVKVTAIAPEHHFKYISGRRAGHIDYDFLME